MRILIVILFSISVLGLKAQTGKVLDARNSVASNDLKNAKILINEASKDEAHKNDPHYYYWRGYIYKELYKEQEKGKTESQFRDESMTSFYKLLDYKNLESILKGSNLFIISIKTINILSSAFCGIFNAFNR